MEWVIYSVAASIIAAIIGHANHFLQLHGAMLVLVRSIFALLIIAPFIAFFEWPTHLSFYLYMLAGIISIFIGDIIFFDAARRLGGRLASIFLPVKIYVAFVVWCVVDQVYLASLFDNPLVTAGILACLATFGVAMANIRHCDTAWPALKEVFPVGVAFALADVFIKTGLEGTDITQTPFILAFMVSAIHIPLVYWFIKHRKIESNLWAHLLTDDGIGLTKKHLVLGGILVGGLGILATYFISTAIVLSPNPGYVSALLLLSIVWLSMYNRLRGFDDRASLREIALLLLSAVGLILLVS